MWNNNKLQVRLLHVGQLHIDQLHIGLLHVRQLHVRQGYKYIMHACQSCCRI